MPTAYLGNENFLFMCYAHADRDAVLSIIRALDDEGYRVWYDDGIQAGSSYPDYIANRLHDCSCVLMLISRSSLGSGWCRNEVDYALELGRPILPVFLEDVELPRALRMRLGGVQALHWYSYDTDESYTRLFDTPALNRCLSDEGKRRRGVKPKDTKTPPPVLTETHAGGSQEEHSQDANTIKETTSRPITERPLPKPIKHPHTKRTPGTKRLMVIAFSLAVVVIVIVAGFLIVNNGMHDSFQTSSQTTMAQPGGTVTGVDVHDDLSGYKWSELKLLSKAITDAKSNDEWERIAKRYNLVDGDGKLNGDEKIVILDDDTMTSVRIIGFHHDELENGERSGISFEFADIPIMHHMNQGYGTTHMSSTATQRPSVRHDLNGTNWQNVINEAVTAVPKAPSNEGGWKESDLRSWLNSDNFTHKLPASLLACVESAKKRTNNGGKVEFEDDTSTVSYTNDKFWLLSMVEVYGSMNTQKEGSLWSSNTYEEEGMQYQLYADQNAIVSKQELLKKNMKDVPTNWWLRSPQADSSTGFHVVSNDGDWNGCNADLSQGVSPCFCI